MENAKKQRDDFCVACGAPAPEGQMLCSSCQRIAYPEQYKEYGREILLPEGKQDKRKRERRNSSKWIYKA